MLTSLQRSFAESGMQRPLDDRVLAGVCSGLARKLGVSTGMVRLAFILSIVLPGSQAILYLLLWMAMPDDGRFPAPNPTTPSAPEDPAPLAPDHPQG